MQILENYFDPDGPGAALVVACEGASPVVECLGFANVEERTPITPDTPFELASVSKWFTATAIMLLVEREKLDIGSAIYEHLPEVERTKSTRPITVRDLLWHTSGLADYLYAGMYTPVDEMTGKYIMGQLRQWASTAIPGQEHSYSNTNYFVLARIVESVTGLGFADFVEANLIEPFGLCSTALAPRKQRRLQIARGYQNVGYGVPFIKSVSEITIDTDGDGGIVSSLNDLMRWQSLFWNCEILNAKSLKLMQTPGTLDSGESFSYGFGLQIEGHGSNRCWNGHGGSWVNSTTLVGHYANSKITVIVLSNEFMAPVERIYQRAFAMSGYKQRR